MTSIYILAAVICLLYAIIIGSFTYGWFRLKKSAISDKTPDNNVTIIIPFRNEENNLEKLLQSLVLIDYPKHLLEIVFINDNSDDNGCKLIELYSQSSPFPIRLLNSPAHGKKAAITYGISQSKGDIIICTDADCVVQCNWVIEIVENFRDAKIKMVIGTVAVSGNHSFWNSFQKVEFMSLVLSCAGAVSIQKPIMANGANIAYLKQVFSEVNGYSGNEQIASGDDVFLMQKIVKNFGNSSVAFQKSKTSLVYTNAQKTLIDFLKQRIRWASKSAAYGTFFTKLTAVTVLAMNLLLVTSLLITPFEKSNIVFFLLIWFFKTIADLPILIGGFFFFGKPIIIVLLPVIEIITAFLTVIPGFLSFFINPVWKAGR